MRARGGATASPWYATPVVAIALLCGLNGFTPMVTWGTWMPTVIALTATVTGLVMMTRLVTRSRFTPTLIGAAAALLVSVPIFGRSADGQAPLLPTPSALRALAAAVGDGTREAATTMAPAEITRPLAALIMVGVFALFLVAEHLAVSWRAAAVAGLMLLVPWMPAVVLQHRVSTAALLGAIGAWVLLLALTSPRVPAVSARSPWGVGMATMATVALVAVTTPAALGSYGWGFLPRLIAASDLDTTSRLNVALDLRDSLTVNSASPALVYLTPGERPDALRVYTLVDFDGSVWSRAQEEDMDLVPLDAPVQWPVPVPTWDANNSVRVSVQVLGQVENSLPLPTVPRSVTVAGDWAYSPEFDEVTSRTTTTQDLSYTFDADFDYLSADRLQALGTASQQDDLLGPGYLDLADAIDADRVRDQARAAIGDAATRYDQAVALQEFFRDPSRFTYDTSVTPSGEDSVSVFLDSGEGYCVQFASAMVVMARALDIPARLAIGFLPGDLGADGASVITGADAHAWPEIYFEGIGWVRFEPTPAVQTGARPAYADPAGVDAPQPDANLAPARPQPTSAPGMVPLPESALEIPEDPDRDLSVTAWWWAALAVVLAGAAGAWWVVRSRQTAAARWEDPERVWTWMRDHVPAVAAWPTTLTPHEAESHLRRLMEAGGVPLSTMAHQRLSDLVAAVSDHRYSPHGSDHAVDNLREGARIVVDELAATGPGSAKVRPFHVDAPAVPRRGA